jgi:hypothetical protein
MNNFVFSQDPLLYTSTIQSHPTNEMDIKRQLDTVMAQYQALQQQQSNPPSAPAIEPKIEDHLGDLDELIKNSDQIIIEALNNNQEFVQLNAWIQQTIQEELIKNIKIKLNSNPELISKVNRAKEIIKEIRINRENEDRKSLSELNDYITNYSDMTFNEYKQLKLSKQK